MPKRGKDIDLSKMILRHSRVICIGECMVEFYDAQDNSWRRGFAGDTLNVAWALRALLNETFKIDYITRVGSDKISQEMLVFLKKQYPQLKVTVHGFRASFRTWAEETGHYQPNAIEFCLAHQLSSQVEKAYLRTDLTEQRRVIMTDWEKYVLSI